MARKKFKKNNNHNGKRRGFFSFFSLPGEVKKLVFGVFTLSLAAIFALSFFDSAGVVGETLNSSLIFLVGKTIFMVPLILVLGGIVFFTTGYRNFSGPIILAILLLTLGTAGFLESISSELKQGGGWLGYFLNLSLSKLFGIIATRVIFFSAISIGLLILWQMNRGPRSQKEKPVSLEEKPVETEAEPLEGGIGPVIKKFFAPKFKVKQIEQKPKESLIGAEGVVSELKAKEAPQKILAFSQYKTPPLDLLELEKGKPLAGDTATNAAIIKKTLDNFGLKVEMSEINIGPTVTQYTLKPAEGIKLSKITALNNNLALALASHPIRIEAPIPGKSLVGIEVPNKERCKVRLRELFSHSDFQKASSNLNIALGKDVSGNYCYADLSRMPHLLVAGSTGTGKTIFLNNLVLSLLYQNSPEILRFILIDPKRVEFLAYRGIPHLLAPVIFDAPKTVNALKWLVSEMERRFGVLSTNGSRDIGSYNAKILKEREKIEQNSLPADLKEVPQTLPFIVLIIDELADLMASRGREVEAGIVRLAQMARAVGIHLVVATQRPSVEVITGLIKANITSRITFQVASQVDSRTVLDMAGAEKLLGAGDLLFLSAEVTKPKRIQGAFVSEKEVKRVVDFVNTQNAQLRRDLISEAKIGEEILENHLAKDLEKSLEGEERSFGETGGEDPLYEEAKHLVFESKKASASLLQRRLRVGYARAARLLDILEERGVVGPADGAKPREVYFASESGLLAQEDNVKVGEEEGEDNWHKV